MTWFGIDLPNVVGSTMGRAAEDMTLIAVTPGTRNPASPTQGTQPTVASVACKGIVSDYDTNEIDGTLVQVEDRMVQLFASTLGTSVPKKSDRVTIASEGKTYGIVRVKRDGAAAVYFCQVRKG